jgi:hypothetical protein
MYSVSSFGHLTLPDDLCSATEGNVEDVLRRAAAYLGRDTVDIARVSSVIGGSCIACVDVVAYVGGTPLLVARPSLY